MTRRTANLLRIGTIAGAVIAAWLLYRLFTPDAPTQTPEPRAGETSVAIAINVAATEPLAVRGYVFQGPGGLGLRLCQGRQRGDPPNCLGPFLDLDGVNETSFSLRPGRIDGNPMQWSEEPVTLVGPVVGTRMTVQQVLR